MKKRLIALGLTLVMLLSLCIIPQAESPSDEVTILFTHDLHSHLLPSTNETGEGEYGGYARLMTVIKEQKALDPNAILVDGGDFAMGSLFQTAYPSAAIELRMMGAMGFDATTFGNHEYDYLQSGLKSMLNAAVDSGDPLPALVCANYLPPKRDRRATTPIFGPPIMPTASRTTPFWHVVVIITCSSAFSAMTPMTAPPIRA